MTAAPPPAPPSVDPPGTAPWPPPPPAGPPDRQTLRRSRDDKMVHGVAGGLAEYSGIDPLLWRVGFVALTLAGGTGIVLYLLLCVVMPAGPRRSGTDVEPAFGAAHRRWTRGHSAPTLPRSPVGRLTLAGVLIGVGVLVLVARLSDWDPGPRPFLGVALLVVGLGLVAAAFVPGRTSRGGLIAVGVVLSLAMVLTSSVPWPTGAGVGDRDYRPATVAEVRDRYELGAGDMTVDLSRIDVEDIDEALRIEIDHGVGDLDVILPREADVRLSLDTGVGQTEVFDGGSSDGGYYAGRGEGPTVDDDEPEFVLTIDHGVGDVEVDRA